MAERKKIKIPQIYIDKYGNNIKIWSYSRIGTFHNCLYEYYLNRIMKYRSEDNIYTLCGTIAHSILEDLYNDKINEKDMADIFNSKFLEVETSDYRFSSDEEKNKRMRNKYKNCLMIFFKNHKKINTKVLTERQIWVDINGNIFIGYVDAINKENNTYIITDFKTSSITEYKGEKLKEHQKQLLLYALGLNQLGISLEKIKIRWLFLKYIKVKYNHKIYVTYLKNNELKKSCLNKDIWVNKIKTQLKKDITEFYPNKNTKEIKSLLDECINSNSLDTLDSSIKNKYKLDECVKIAESNKWVETIKTQLKKDIIEFYECEPWEADIKISECINSNSLDTLDSSIQSNYIFEDCYVYGEINQESINNLINEMTEDINKINSNGINEKSWEIENITKDKEYYCNVLCGVSSKCKYYTEYLKTLHEDQVEDDELMKELEGLI